ncbi:uncharacterized protein CXorf38 homolog [Mercenaria mercenaria]|uniref:uncharacterized protein CXorf38 homolog n=1 Tax=Mercenaria mercenaria TaxID=6596 RepID=UPI00234F191E|nr:uncharacterized protein CXorf38 homolog [Mercenaria mercenaria]
MAERKDSSESKISETKFHNWIKSGLALMHTRNGIQPFVIDEITAFQQTMYSGILTLLGIDTDSKCSACTTNAIICDKVFEKCRRRSCTSFHRECPERGLCTKVKEKIIKAHRYHGTSWMNTDAKLWCSDPWQIAKCYMPREGYSTQMSADETDFNGIVNIILNNENFAQKLSAKLTDSENIFRKPLNMMYVNGKS